MENLLDEASSIAFKGRSNGKNKKNPITPSLVNFNYYFTSILLPI
jgi:hypothetical protein